MGWRGVRAQGLVDPCSHGSTSEHEGQGNTSEHEGQGTDNPCILYMFYVP